MMSFLKEILPKNGLQVAMVMSIAAIISKDFLDRSGPFTDSYLMDIVWILALSAIYLIYVKENVWAQISLLTAQLVNTKNESNITQLFSLIGEIQRELEVLMKNAMPQGATSEVGSATPKA